MQRLYSEFLQQERNDAHEQDHVKDSEETDDKILDEIQEIRKRKRPVTRAVKTLQKIREEAHANTQSVAADVTARTQRKKQTTADPSDR